MERSTARTVDSPQEQPTQVARQQLEGGLVARQVCDFVRELAGLLAVAAALLDLTGELRLEHGDIALELPDPVARFTLVCRRRRALRFEPALQLRQLVGHARELLAEERAIEVLREQLLRRRRLGVQRARGIEPETRVEGVERARHGFQGREALGVVPLQRQFYLCQLLLSLT